jgi:flagellar biosynthesis GTPase FlhF
MVDEEVENTLREIRERVRKTAEMEAAATRSVASSAADGSVSSGELDRTPETIARIDGYLTTTARAWDRLPPIISSRSGGIARLELWVKRRFKQATRWYSWEQINFNAAVHHALRDTLEALQDLEQQLGQLRSQLTAERETRAQLEQKLGHNLEQNLAALRAETEALRVQMEAQREAEQRARSLEVNARLSELSSELHQRDTRGLEEQRVCFKQLSLEMSEAEVLLDRVRRDLEARLERLEAAKGK